MTQAVCFNCGTIKFGAFNHCDSCGALPRSDDDLLVSLAFSDHYLDLATLGKIGQDIKAGSRPALPDEIKDKLRPGIVEFKRIVGAAGNSGGRTKPKAKQPLIKKFFGLFAQSKSDSSPPLTHYCIGLSKLLSTVQFLEYLKTASKGSTKEDRSAVVLSILSFALAGHFVANLRSNKNDSYRDVREYFRDTNMDIIAAEAVVWVLWALRIHWNNDLGSIDRARLDRISEQTFGVAGRHAVLTIQKETGIDFWSHAIESDKFYSSLLKANPSRPLALAEGFASILMDVAGHLKFDYRSKPVTASWMLSDAWLPLNMVIHIFYTTMPLGAYETFKNIVKHSRNLGLDES